MKIDRTVDAEVCVNKNVYIVNRADLTKYLNLFRCAALSQQLRPGQACEFPGPNHDLSFDQLATGITIVDNRKRFAEVQVNGGRVLLVNRQSLSLSMQTQNDRAKHENMRPGEPCGIPGPNGEFSYDTLATAIPLLDRYTVNDD